VELLDSRRLTGPNLVSASPGALLDVSFLAENDTVVELWRDEIESLLKQEGLPEMDLIVKPRQNGAWLVVSGPIDQLYGLIDLSELAWQRAVGRITNFIPEKELGEAPPLDLEGILQQLSEELNPPLIALQQAAKSKNVSFFWDDDYASLGMGKYAQTWPVRELPPLSDIDWSSFNDIPLGVVTGTNGKSTNIRLLSFMATCAGLISGNTSTDWIRVGNEILDAGDYSGPGGARTVLRDQRVEIAFLETARGGLLRRGAGVERANVALITNVAEDHMGQYGIHSVADLTQAKMIVQRLVRNGGVLVLNADDENLVRAAASLKKQDMCWFSRDDRNATIRSHVEQGGRACVVQDGAIVYKTPGGTHQIALVSEIPITLDGKAAYNVSNCLSATAVAMECGLPLDAVRQGLIDFENTPGTNPGRSNYFQVGRIKVLLDYAHNVHGLAAILATTAQLGAKRRILTLSTAGDRTEREIRQLAALAATSGVDEILVSDCIGYERELGAGGVPRILTDELLRHGVQAATFNSELDAVKAAFERAQDGDILILLVKAERYECVDLIHNQNQSRSE
jgi:cyanophycin synthetase